MSAAAARLEHLDALLQDPPADGLMVIGSDGELGALQVGDVVVACNDLALRRQEEWLDAVRKEREAGRPIALRIHRDGRTTILDAPAAPQELDLVEVRAGASAWPHLPDHAGAPDLSAFAAASETWMRNSFENEVAGFEAFRITPEDDTIRVEEVFRIGGGCGEDWQWDYLTRMRSVHRLDRVLDQVETAFWKRRGGVDEQIGAARREGTRWRGTWTHGKRSGTEAPAEVPMLSGYATPLLALTLPLERGAAITTTWMRDGVPVPRGRSRLLVEERETVDVAGTPTAAWRVRWCHYGSYDPAEDERFYVSDERRLVRIEWGPRYQHCVTELVDRERALGECPPCVPTDLPW